MEEWAVVEELIEILEVQYLNTSICDMIEQINLLVCDNFFKPFEAATLSFSKKDKAHLPDVLPTYSRLKGELCASSDRLRKAYGAGRDPYGLLSAIAEGDKKLEKYFKLARESDLTLISSGKLS